ncbi:MAG TPA: type IV pilus assembly protein PilM [Candidatus Polarisedimenticolia bacterium]|nr:type IV pilus assembly protein PilM [Candidatus Polarisedimenticolia bacterium]
MTPVFFSRSKSLVGLDIGTSSIKAVELKELGKGRGYQLANMGIEPLSPEAIVDGAIMDSGLVVEGIQNVFSRNKIKGSDVAISLSGHSVIIKKISLPVMNPDELAESIQWEAEQYIPFDVDDVNIDYQVLQGSTTAGEGNMDVLLVAVKKDKINDYMSVITQAGKNALVADVDVFALQNAYEINYEAVARKLIALINVGASVTNVAVMQSGSSIFWRDLSVGGNNYTDALQKELNLTFEQAEAAKKGDATAAPRDRVTAIIDAVNEQVGTEIQKTLDFFKATSASDPVSLIELTGGAARTPNLAPYLSRRFETQVEIMNPFRSIAVNERAFPPDRLEPLTTAASVAVGLALRKVGDK